MTYDLDHKADHYCPAYKKVISAGTSVTISVRTFLKKAMDMKLLCKVISETAGFFEKKKIRQFRCLQTDFIK